MLLATCLGGFYVLKDVSIRSGLLLAGYGGLLAAAVSFPHSHPWSVSLVLGQLIFSPIKLLVAAFMFSIGFLAYSLFVQDLCKILFLEKNGRPGESHVRLAFVLVAGVSLIHLFFHHWIVALLGGVFALFYGIMDVDLPTIWRNRRIPL